MNRSDAATDHEGRPAPARRPLHRRPAVVVPLSLGALALVVVGLLVFQPWKLFVDDVVDEALPTAVASAPASEPSASAAAPSASAPASPTATAPVESARGTFVTHEHETTGSVRLLTLADGTQVLRIEDLDTSNGPDLRVWLSDQPVIDGRDGWFVFDDGEYVELGRLKGNVGNQNYVVPAGTDLDSLTSVSIWCARFSVSFGAAELRSV
jgi:hypothetical protein